MNNWLTKAERLKMQLNEHKNELKKQLTPENLNADDEENNAMLNQCLIQ